jgi:hypothetical protein
MRAEVVLTARSQYLRGLAAIAIAVGVVFAVLFGYGTIAFSASILPVALFGVVAGWVLGGSALARVTVFTDGLVMENMWRVYTVPCEEVVEVRALSGIRVVLQSSRVIMLSVFPGNLHKLYSGNREASVFAEEKLRPALGLPADGSPRPTAEPATPSALQTRVRWLTPVLMIAFAAANVGLAGVVRLITNAG